MTNLAGLFVSLPEPCPCCRSHDAVIGAGHGPYKVAIRCICGQPRGRMSDATFHFLTEIVRCFGRPTETICVTRKTAKDGADNPSNVTATANAPKGVANGKHQR
jgi:hypothetical protein